MELIKSKLGQGGIFLAVMGIISMVLAIFNYNLSVLAWIDIWGSTFGWIIRVALILGGGALFFFFGNDEEDVE